MTTIQPKIPGGISNGTEIPGKKFWKIWLKLSSFSEIPEKKLFPSALEMFEIETGIFS